LLLAAGCGCAPSRGRFSSHGGRGGSPVCLHPFATRRPYPNNPDARTVWVRTIGHTSARLPSAVRNHAYIPVSLRSRCWPILCAALGWLCCICTAQVVALASTDLAGRSSSEFHALQATTALSEGDTELSLTFAMLAHGAAYVAYCVVSTAVRQTAVQSQHTATQRTAWLHSGSACSELLRSSRRFDAHVHQ